MKKLKIVLVLFAFGFMFSCKAQQAQTDIQQQIVGSWIAEDDLGVKLVFNQYNNQCTSYFNNEVMDTYIYSISQECNNEFDNNGWYLKLTDSEGARCYEVYGANNNTLSMRDMLTGKIFVYNKL